MNDTLMKCGKRIDRPGDFLLTMEMLLTHMAVLGGTGSGKSKFLELLMKFLAWMGEPFLLIDPHGDLSTSILAYIGKKKLLGLGSTWERVHYIEPSFEHSFGYDPFRFDPPPGLHPDFRGSARRAWLHARVDRVIEVLQRKQGQADVAGMPRLQRVLTDVLTAVGTAIDADGRHLPLGDALVLLDMHHPRHGDLYERVAPLLDSYIRADFERWHRMRNPEAFLREAESTINRLRSFLSPIIQAVFSQTVHTIDFKKIIKNGEIALVNLHETPFFSGDQKTALGGLFIHDTLRTLEQTEEHERRQFCIIVDEAGEFLGKDLEWALGAMRKYMTSLVLAGQDLSTFRRGEDFDMVPKLLSMCRVKVCFQNTWPDDLQILARVLCTGDLDFTPLLHAVDRPDGHDIIELTDWSESFGISEKRETTQNATWSKGKNKTKTKGHSKVENWTQQKTWGSSTSDGRNAGQSMDRDGTIRGRNAGNSHADSASEGGGVGQGGATGDSESTAEGETDTHGGGQGSSSGTAENASITVSHKTTLVPRTREEIQKTGQLEQSVADQMEKFMAKIHGLKRRQAVVTLPDQKGSMTVEIAAVEDPFLSKDARHKTVEQLKRDLRRKWDYFFVPDLTPEESERRLAELLGADEPVVTEKETKRKRKPMATPFD